MNEPVKVSCGPHKPPQIAQPFYRRGVWAAVESKTPLGHSVLHIPSGMKPPGQPWNGCTSDEAINICRILADWDENFASDAPFGAPPAQMPPVEVLNAICEALEHEYHDPEIIVVVL